MTCSDADDGTLAFFGGRWEERNARNLFRRALGGTERSQIFSEGAGRNGTLANVIGGRWEERNARKFDLCLMGGTERPQFVFGGRWEERNARKCFSRALGGTERSQIFSEGAGRKGTFANVFGGRWEERNARIFRRALVVMLSDS
jgi:hypothetical protein